MGFRFRKSIGLGSGVRLNVGKRGFGVSVGTRGARYSVNSSGRRTASVGVPGTGVGYTSSRSAGRRRSSAPVAPAEKPGLFAPRHEKEFHRALQAYAEGDVDRARELFRSSSAADSGGRALADDLFAGLLGVQAGRADEAIPYLENVVASDVGLPDELMVKYGVQARIELDVTERVRVTVELGSAAAALALVECYQAQGRIEEAIGVLQQLADVGDDPAIMLSLCDLYAETGAWDELVDAAAGVQNADDVTLEVRLPQARALREQGLDDGAIEVYKDALRSRKRDPELLREARYERGKLFLGRGRRAQAMKDLQLVYSEDPHYRDVAELVRGEGAG